MSGVTRWAPGSLLSLGVVLTLGLGDQRAMDLEMPLDEAVSHEILGLESQHIEVSEGEAEVAGFDEYFFRAYGPTEAPEFTLYVGYYASQTRGHTIHSPKNCLPGAGWEALVSEPMEIVTSDGRTVTVNKYLLQKEEARALVLYWYQGRGRVAHDEYQVKLDLLKDAALRQRSDEALVRIVVPMTDSEAEAAGRAKDVASRVIPEIDRALPTI